MTLVDSEDIPSVAVIGCGYWGKNIVRNLHALGSLGMVYEPTESGRTLARELASGIEVVEDLEVILSSREIEAVAIATPAETHRELAERCLNAGKDVFVEKQAKIDESQNGNLDIS